MLKSDMPNRSMGKPEMVNANMLKWIWISAIVIFVDQITKWTAEAHLKQGEPMEVIAHLNFTLAYNYGAAFSFLSDQGGWQRWLFAILAMAISIMIIFWLRSLRQHETWTAIGLSLVLGGAIGNLIDRLLNEGGRVVDFIDFYAQLPFDYFFNFAIFNIADVAITMGAILLIGISLFGGKEEEVKPQSQELR